MEHWIALPVKSLKLLVLTWNLYKYILSDSFAFKFIMQRDHGPKRWIVDIWKKKKIEKIWKNVNSPNLKLLWEELVRLVQEHVPTLQKRLMEILFWKFKSIN